MARELVIGLTGATGFTFGVNFVRYLVKEKVGVIEPMVVLSEAAKKVCESEMGIKLQYVHQVAELFLDCGNCDKKRGKFSVYSNDAIWEKPASGSYLTEGMVILPCSMKTASDIAYSRAENLITRAADVTLKEGRRLVLCVRETPLHKGHLENLLRCADLGAVIMPLVVSLYEHIETIKDLSDHFTGRILDIFNIHNNLTRRWKGE